MKQHNVSLIHCHKSSDVTFAALLDSLSPRKVFFTEHMGARRSKRDFFHRWTYTHVDKVFSISDVTRQRNIKALPLPQEKITRLWLGTNVDNTPIDATTANQLKKSLNIPKDSYIVGTLGRLCEGKGQLELIHAFASVSQQRDNAHLLIVGGTKESEGSSVEYVAELEKTIIDLKLSDKVHFSGFRSDTSNMLALMDCVCLPYHDEAFGLTAIESMAACKPIVASNTGALPEVLENCALYSAPNNHAELSSCIMKFMNDPQLANEMAESGVERVTQYFSQEVHINQLERFYADL
jgi:glycosyltransferase involved in cell wall biosynthesis